MSTIDSEHGWEDCPRGALGQLDRRLRTRRRNRLVRESSLLVVMAMLIGVTAGYLAAPGTDGPNRPGNYNFAGISCNEVHMLLPQLVANRLEAAKAMQVRRHVNQCPNCRPLMEQMQAGDAVARAVSGRLGPTLAKADVAARLFREEL